MMNFADIATFKKLSLEEKRSIRAKKDKLKRSKMVKAKVSAKACVCDKCGDRFAGPPEYTSDDDYVYCSQYCHDEG